MGFLETSEQPSGSDGQKPVNNQNGTNRDEPETTARARSHTIEHEQSPPRSTEPHGRLATRSRNRTPWDGNGFSMPAAQDAAGTSPAPADPYGPQPHSNYSHGYSSDSMSPRHRLSDSHDSRDSRTSLSSAYTTASSSNVMPHSRMSSLSTVAENQLPPYYGGPPSMSAHWQSHADMQSRRPSYRSRHRQSQSQSQSHSYSQSHGRDYDMEPFYDSHRLPIRSREPEMQGSRYRLPSLLHEPSWQSLPAPESGLPGRMPVDDMVARLNGHRSNSHNRTTSAPDFPAGSALAARPAIYGMSPRAAPSYIEREMELPPHPSERRSQSVALQPATPFSSQSLSTSVSNASSHQSQNHPGPNRHQPDSPTTPTFIPPIPTDFDEPPKCLYESECTTGSQLRKAISHIFGRNKSATRNVPPSAWVHYCRKHYQRTRYRSGTGYPLCQIGLVRNQIQRVQAWSDANLRRGTGDILKSWTLSIRKREQKRLTDAVSTGRKRSYSEHDEADEEEQYTRGRTMQRGSKTTAVPTWLQRCIRDDYTSAQILDIVDSLEADLRDGILSQIPDIEILPRVDKRGPGSHAIPRTPKTPRRTRGRTTMSTSSAVHPRQMQSSSGAAHESSRQHDRAMPDMEPAEKRQRTDSDSSGYVVPSPPYRAHPHAEPHGSQNGAREHGVYERDAQDYGHRNGSHAYNHQHGSQEYGHGVPTGLSRSPSGSSILPPPSTERLSGPSDAQRASPGVVFRNIENHGYRGMRPHVRSQSDTAYLEHHSAHRPTASPSPSTYAERLSYDANYTHRQPLQHSHRPSASTGYAGPYGMREPSQTNRLPPLIDLMHVAFRQTPRASNTAHPQAPIHTRRQSSPAVSSLPGRSDMRGEPRNDHARQ